MHKCKAPVASTCVNPAEPVCTRQKQSNLQAQHVAHCSRTTLPCTSTRLADSMHESGQVVCMPATRCRLVVTLTNQRTQDVPLLHLDRSSAALCLHCFAWTLMSSPSELEGYNVSSSMDARGSRAFKMAGCSCLCAKRRNVSCTKVVDVTSWCSAEAYRAAPGIRGATLDIQRLRNAGPGLKT